MHSCDTSTSPESGVTYLPSRTGPRRSAGRIRVLYIEDNEEQAELVKSYLTSQGNARFHFERISSIFAQVITELIQAVAGGGDLERSQDSSVDLLGCNRISMCRIMRVSWILMPGNVPVPTVIGKARRCNSGNST